MTYILLISRFFDYLITIIQVIHIYFKTNDYYTQRVLIYNYQTVGNSAEANYCIDAITALRVFDTILPIPLLNFVFRKFGSVVSNKKDSSISWIDLF